ncbi:MAG: LuxR C-terminal-related transcriptional regulator [Myxococcales bacterium]|nr:LuxR C-terminal-related transcriptional regulator [Myxococcales bacterium]
MLARELAAWIDRAPLSARPLREVVAQLPALLGADQACAFLVRPDHELDFFHGARMPAGISAAYAKWLRQAPKNFASYDPARPDPRQRNLALRTADIAAITGQRTPAVVRSFLPRFALSESDQLRALICDGPVLLAWVGGFRARPFARAGVRQLQAIVPSLQRRLALERSLVEAQRTAQQISDALEQVPAAAYVLGRGGAVLHANAAGRSVLERERKTVEEQLSAALRGGESSIQIARLAPHSDLQLAIAQAPSDPAPRVAAARLRWQLTNRQTQVLHLVAQGFSNRRVAASLGCSESTVELHVTALLEKAGGESRAQLVASVWGGG